MRTKKPTKYSKRLREMRKAAGLTQRELAKKTGIPGASIATYELGTASIRIELYDKLIGACKRQIRRNHRLVED